MADAEPASRASPDYRVSEPADNTPDTLHVDSAHDGNKEHGCLTGEHPRPTAIQQPIEDFRMTTGSNSSPLDSRTPSSPEENLATYADEPARLVADVGRGISDIRSPQGHTPSILAPSALSAGDHEKEDVSSQAGLLHRSCLGKRSRDSSLPFDGDCLAKVTNEETRLPPKAELPSEKGDEQQLRNVANVMHKAVDGSIHHGQKLDMGVIAAFPVYEVRVGKDLEAASKNYDTGRAMAIFAQEQKRRRRPDRVSSFRGDLNEEISFLSESRGRSRRNPLFGDGEEDKCLSNANVGRRGHRRRTPRELPSHEPPCKSRHHETGWDSPEFGYVESTIDSSTVEIQLRPILKNHRFPAYSRGSSQTAEQSERRGAFSSRTRHSAQHPSPRPRKAFASRSLATTVVDSRPASRCSSGNASAVELAYTSRPLLKSVTEYARKERPVYEQRSDSAAFPRKHWSVNVIPHDVCDNHSRSYFCYMREPAVRNTESGLQAMYGQIENLKTRWNYAKNKHREHKSRLMQRRVPDTHWRQRKDEPTRSSSTLIVVHRNTETSLEGEDASCRRLSMPVGNRWGCSIERMKKGFKGTRKCRERWSCSDNVALDAMTEVRKRTLKRAEDDAVPALETPDNLVMEVDSFLSRDSESVQEPIKRSYSDSETLTTTKARSVTFGRSQAKTKRRSVTFVRSQSSLSSSASGVEKVSQIFPPEKQREPSVDDGSQGKPDEDAEEYSTRTVAARIGTRNSALYAGPRTQTTEVVCTSKSAGNLPSKANATSSTDASNETWALTNAADRPTLSFSVNRESREKSLNLLPGQWSTQMAPSPESHPSYHAWTRYGSNPFQREHRDDGSQWNFGGYSPMPHSDPFLFPGGEVEPYRYMHAQQAAMSGRASFVPLPGPVPSPYPSVATASVFPEEDLGWGGSLFSLDKLQRLWSRTQAVESRTEDFHRNQATKPFFFEHGNPWPDLPPMHTVAPARPNFSASFGAAFQTSGTEAFLPRPKIFFDGRSSVRYRVPRLTSPPDSPAPECVPSLGSISKDQRRPATSTEDKPTAAVQGAAVAKSCTTSEVNRSLSSDSSSSVAWEVGFFDDEDTETAPVKGTSTDSILGTKDHAFMKKFTIRGFNSFYILFLVCALVGIAAGWSMLTKNERSLTTENDGDDDSNQEFMSGPWFHGGDAVGVKRASCLSPLCSKQVAQLVRSLRTAVPPCKNFYGHVCSPPQSRGKANELPKQQTESRLIAFFKGTGSPDMDLPVAAASRRLWKDCADMTTLGRQGKAPLQALLNQTGLGGWPYDTSHALPNVWEVAGLLQRFMAIAPLLEISALPGGTLYITCGGHSGSDEVGDVLKAMSALGPTGSRLRKLAADVADMGRGLRGLQERLPPASLSDDGEQTDVLPRAFLERALKGLRHNLGSALTEPGGVVQQLVAFVNESKPRTVLNYLGYRMVQHVHLLTPAGVKAKPKSDAVHRRESQCAKAVLEGALPAGASEYVRYAALRKQTDFKSVRSAFGPLKNALGARLADWMDASTLKSARQHLAELKVLFLFDRYEGASASAQAAPIALPSRALATYQRFREARFRSRLLQGFIEDNNGQEEHCVYDADNKVLYVRLSAVDVRDTGSPQWRLLQAAWMGPRVSRCLLRVLLPPTQRQHGRQSVQWSPTASDRLNALRACLRAQQRARYPAARRQSGGSEQEALLAVADSAALGPARDVFDAYAERLTDKNSESEPIKDTAGTSFGWDKVFYVAYARSLCEEEDQERPLDQSHPERVNAPLSNDKGFLRAFQCQRGDAMLPSTTCALWNAHR